MESQLNNFMYVYMYHLENYLLSKKEEIKGISFQSDEANTDRPLKEYMKNLIEKDFNKIPQNSNIKLLNIESKQCEDMEVLQSFKINKVLLPENITQDIKEHIVNLKAISSVYTNPDLCFEITSCESKYWVTIELKSTKNNSIPGSSIQQITPDEWVIFIKHKNESIDIVTGKYINSINYKMQFPDRSPRPDVSFKELKDWNKKYRIFYNEELKYLTDENSNKKFDLISDWQKVLADRWVNMLFECNTIKSKEPWFNNNMRKFILEFLNKYDSLSTDEQIAFKVKIQNLITK